MVIEFDILTSIRLCLSQSYEKIIIIGELLPNYPRGDMYR